MTLKTLATATTFTLLCLTPAVFAQDLGTAPGVTQLIETNQCQGCNLEGADLSNLNLSNANLSGANLSNANLRGTNLSNANLSGASLSNAVLAEANLYLANLVGADLRGADLSEGTLTGANLENADLTAATLGGATLNYVTFSNASLLTADLSQADLSDANLVGANLSGARLTNASLSNADLSNADLSGADLSGTQMVSANLAEANLTQANLSNANLTGAQLETATLTEANLANTRLDNTVLAGDPIATASDEAADLTLAPQQQPPIRLFNLETANQQPGGSLSFFLGTRLFFNEQGEFGGGSGLQVNTLNVDWGITDSLQVGAAVNLYSDILPNRIVGNPVNLKYLSGALSAKYQVIEAERFNVAILGSAELLNIRTNTTSFLSGIPTDGFLTDNVFAGSVQVPFTYTFNPTLQVHVTPAVSFFPSTSNGAPFYGTVARIGAGLSWQPLERLGFFGDVQVPFGPGGNTVRARDAEIVNRPVWSAGLRYLLNPASSLDIYLTNAFGNTPATNILTLMPGSDQAAVAVSLNFDPDFGQNYAEDFRSGERTPLTPRDTQLVLDGITLTHADTLLPRTLRAQGGFGAGVGGSVATALTHDVQVELWLSDFDQTKENYRIDEVTVGAAAKVRFLDQVQGDPFSFSIKGSFGEQVSAPRGFSMAEGIFQYRPIPELALILNPKAGVIGNDTLIGAGLGINYQIWRGLQVLGEYTPFFTGETGVWSVGLRYFDPGLKLGVDVYGSNAAGRYSFSSIAAQSDPVVGVNVHWLFGGGY
ncbi:hypothetical protein GS597_11095 [Synechococcales cyanobacterium C]|uniref:Pentapeptide repeat-containing protein n=1 Tax=Petrachloros mirabilis ULC683 TaxID=2781853 RepID=A0A8K1ZZW4_9CYAN|nr:pentapeptide repeat-containing protein [Petrachloros mirabilis]NCJ07043.1 hypothetical protein [Petrachloros mirabilis ULC683]